MNTFIICEKVHKFKPFNQKYGRKLKIDSNYVT